MVVESWRESTTSTPLVVDSRHAFDNQQLFFLVRSQLPVARLCAGASCLSGGPASYPYEVLPGLLQRPGSTSYVCHRLTILKKGWGGEASGHPASCHVGWGLGVGQHTVHFHLFCTSRTFFVSPALICLLAGFPGPPNFFSGFCIFSASCSSFTSLHLCHVASLLFTLHFRCTWPAVDLKSITGLTSSSMLLALPGRMLLTRIRPLIVHDIQA